MGADQKEYTDCYDVIQRTLLADIGRLDPRTTDSQHGSSSFVTTPVIILIGVAGFVAGAVAFLGARSRGE